MIDIKAQEMALQSSLDVDNTIPKGIIVELSGNQNLPFGVCVQIMGHLDDVMDEGISNAVIDHATKILKMPVTLHPEALSRTLPDAEENGEGLDEEPLGMESFEIG